MVTSIILAILLTMSIVLTHADKLVQGYRWLYKKIKKPKFVVGEFVMINGVEFEVMTVVKNSKPYTYFCFPVNQKYSRIVETYYQESEIRKKTGLLKELE